MQNNKKTFPNKYSNNMEILNLHSFVQQKIVVRFRCCCMGLITDEAVKPDKDTAVDVKYTFGREINESQRHKRFVQM